MSESTLTTSPTCSWGLDTEDGNTWTSQCGGYFTINEGTPTENGMKFCLYCGHPLVEDDEDFSIFDEALAMTRAAVAD